MAAPLLIAKNQKAEIIRGVLGSILGKRR